MVASFPARIMFIIGIAAAVLGGDRSAEVMHEHYAYVAEGNPGPVSHHLGERAGLGASPDHVRRLGGDPRAACPECRECRKAGSLSDDCVTAYENCGASCVCCTAN
ncbi:hypothetical protein FOZ60_013429 [Perkinsus olseni]|uniref:Uncharacterized protein n=1 Tax=Perkinsus olseni TaxID=32597 RepID=A0A7J6N9T2_PEROL|nr:hypothetical protein FOZ60_013429 [Perkinsus olseni]